MGTHQLERVLVQSLNASSVGRGTVCGAVAAALVSASSLLAATPAPMIMGLQPVAIQIGTTAELTVHARYSMDGCYRVLVSGTGVTGEPSEAPKKATTRPTRKETARKGRRRVNIVESLKVRFHADPNALPGVRDVRVACSRGVSTVGQLVVVSDPVVTESGDNDSPEKAQWIKLPATVCGTIERREDRDYYKFHVDAGRSLVFRVRGMALEDRIHDLQLHLDPIIALYGPNGATLAVCDNDISGDPLLGYRFEHAGDYTLEIRDVRYKGDQNWVYCIEINDRPFVRTALPLGVAAGTRVAFQPVGFMFARSARIDWTVPREWAPGVHEVQLPLKHGRTNPFPIFVANLPVIGESDLQHGTLKTAQPVSVPAGINGRIDGEGDADVYSFRAKKGQALTFEIVSRRLGSPLDSILRLFDAKGNVLREGDDLTDLERPCADALIENWRAPADGTFAIEVRDLLRHGGPAYVYFLKIARAQPEFELTLDTAKTELAPGTRAVIFVRCLRKNGFDGRIAISVDGLPTGVTAFCGSIPANHRDGCIILSAAADARPSVAEIIVRGTSTAKHFDGSTVRLCVVAQPLEEIYVPGGGRGHWPVETHAVAVAAESDLRGVTLSRREIELRPGQSARIDVTIARAPGFQENVMLDPTFQHLGRIFGDTLPRGVEIDAKNSKTLLSGDQTHGYITFRAAPNVEPMQKRPVSVMANVSINFVMKETFSSPPLFVTTLSK
jgi:hypothetical protein